MSSSNGSAAKVAAPLVSVIVPVYNGERHLARTIDSVLAQTYPEVELIAVDDGSTDDSARLLTCYGRRITLIRQSNAGVAAARNAGIQAARGDWIAFLDQDDWWHPEKLARQVVCAQGMPDVGLVHTDVLFFHDATRGYVTGFPRSDAAALSGPCYERLLLGNDICQSSVLVRRAVLEQVGLFDTQNIRGNTVQDYDLWLRIARVSRLAYLPEKLVVYRLHAAQGSGNTRAFLTETVRVLERALGPAGWPGGPAMRGRLARLLEDLGVAHLDAGEQSLARRCFAKALWLRRSLRTALLLSATLVPAAGLAAFRRMRAAWKPTENGPSWAQPDLSWKGVGV